MGLDTVIATDYAFQVFGTRDEMTEAASSFIQAQLNDCLNTSNIATLALSGGSTPKPIYEHLSISDLEWSRIKATLVDDRVTDDPNGLNANMVRNILVQNKAVDLNFQPLNEVIDEIQFNSLVSRTGFDLTIMGMGTDGHTASWFPGSADLKAALDPDTEIPVMPLNAQGCPGAGNYPSRLTMTLPTVLNSRKILLLLTGEEKRKVFENAANKSVYDAPVKALLAAGSRLTVMWAP